MDESYENFKRIAVEYFLSVPSMLNEPKEKVEKFIQKYEDVIEDGYKTYKCYIREGREKNFELSAHSAGRCLSLLYEY